MKKPLTKSHKRSLITNIKFDFEGASKRYSSLQDIPKPILYALLKEIARSRLIHSDDVFWRHVFGETDSSRADVLSSDGGRAIRGLRYRENLSQTELASQLHISQSNLSAIEHGKRPIGKALAKKLSQIFDISYKVFL